jgi:hypothetical protein
VDFLISEETKILVIKVKSSALGKYESIQEFVKNYSKHINNCYVFSQKDYQQEKIYSLCLYIYYHLYKILF